MPPPTVESLPEVLPWGLEGDHVAIDTELVEPLVLEAHAGAPLLVAGPAGSGVTTALSTLATAWRGRGVASGARAGASRVGGHRVVVSVAAATASEEGGFEEPVFEGPAFDLVVRPESAEAALGELDASVEVLVVVDEAHRLVADPVLDRLASSPRCRLVLGGRSDRLVGAMTTWARLVRTVGTAVLLIPRDRDGDAYGVRLGRRFVADRPGRGVVIRGGEVRPLQLAMLLDPSDRPAEDPEVP